MFYNRKLIIIILLSIFLSSCFINNTTKTIDENKNNKVALIKTKYGDIKILLYNKTPLHRDNFIKLINENFYDSLLFHRVIKNFMIQGGDPTSKNAKPNIMLGNGGPKYTIPAEFDTSLIHKKGVIAAAREGDNVNPNKESSSSQFYIVQGQKVTDEQLDLIEKQINFHIKQDYIKEYISNPENAYAKKKLISLQENRDNTGINKLIQEIEFKEKEHLDSIANFKYSIKQREIYKVLGGTPHLDMNYTVFGEIISGMNILDSIANVKTDRNNRPLDDIIFNISEIK